MPTTPEHLRLAQQFRSFVEESNPLALPGKQIELAVAACYWSALHYIDAILAFPEVSKHPESEGERGRTLVALGHMTKVIPHQRLLNDRYDDLMYRGRQITDIDFEFEVLDSYREVVATCERILRGHRDLP